MKELILTPLKNENRGGDIIRSCSISRLNEGKEETSSQILWFQFPKVTEAPASDDCDSYLLSMLLEGMKENRKIIVKGSVSLELLSNLVELQSAWNKWLPKKYNVVDIEVDLIREPELRKKGAVCAFSGGVDATFSVWRHSQKKHSYRSQQINLCALIHGFDIPLTEQKAFDNAFIRAEKTLLDLELKLVQIKTNYREISKVLWPHSHALALVAALNQLKYQAGTGLIGSSESYDSLVIPWGSSPITDHLLSSDEFTVIHDGASHNRTEKVSEIAEWTTGANNLRVCWEGDVKDKNCGKCEKCIRTKLNFLACGFSIPKCFPTDTNLTEQIIKLKFRNDVERTEWAEIIKHADKNNIKADWKKAANTVIKRKSWYNFIKLK
ncbi:hypothetical protein [Shewanella woodyi]|uniref:Uncharacterized protein n=1 Tax=Shewanella woodyi (strain ATCC 51908 / MS32) TaxID=392500 RepID=B1KQ32_SHEWM|nr:hypothetical protein [Shewanella woodyi]ACA89145.1 conserved hypothetical protein [Shewanella woodyi ATCC 51908]